VQNNVRIWQVVGCARSWSGACMRGSHVLNLRAAVRHAFAAAAAARRWDLFQLQPGRGPGGAVRARAPLQPAGLATASGLSLALLQPARRLRRPAPRRSPAGRKLQLSLDRQQNSTHFGPFFLEMGWVFIAHS